MPIPAVLNRGERHVLRYLVQQPDGWIPAREVPNIHGMVIAHGSRRVAEILQGLQSRLFVERRDIPGPIRAAQYRVTEAGRLAFSSDSLWR